MFRALRLALAVTLAAPAAGAEAPATSPRPAPRPMVEAGSAAVVTAADPAPSRPLRRPDMPAPAPAAGEIAALPAAAPASLRPKPRPEGLAAATLASAAVPEPAPETGRKKKPKASAKGAICGDPEITGEALAPVKGKVKGCGIEAPVRVTAISGIRLNQPATISCDTAAAFKSWIETALRPAMGKREVVEIRIAASYVCRPRNNQKGAKISEHGRGQAVDVAGFVFADGTQWSVAQNYNGQVRKAHKAACGIFGTTLGPGSDGYHEDHLHFDIANYRGGPYCR